MADLVVITTTTLSEIARAISEYKSQHWAGELCWPHLEPEWKVLNDLFRRRAEQAFGTRVNNDVCDLAAILILDGMVAQHRYDLRLFAQSLPPFRRE
jgi:hypothetical protein